MAQVILGFDAELRAQEIEHKVLGPASQAHLPFSEPAEEAEEVEGGGDVLSCELLGVDEAAQGLLERPKEGWVEAELPPVLYC